MKAFIDSSVLIAGCLSEKGFARDLINAALDGAVETFVSSYVLLETRRNLAKKGARALPFFEIFRASHVESVVDPDAAAIQEAAAIVFIKDAPVVAAARSAGAQFLASYDRQHLHARAALIQAHFGIEVVVPEEVIRRIAGGR